MKTLQLIAALLLITGIAAAQQNEKLPPRVVRVVGTSEVKVVPDCAVIEMGVAKQNASARLAKQAADAASRDILSNLRANGIDEKDIQTTYLSLQPQYNYRNAMKISYFTAEQTLSVTVRELSKLDALLESLLKTGVNQINSIEYETSDLRKYRDQAREQAMQAAREKATALVRALGQDIGKVYSIEEVPQLASQYSSNYASNSLSEIPRAGLSGPTTAAGQEKISASVIVTFDLN